MGILPTQPEIVFDRDKFKDLIHYICFRSDSSKLGKTKLHKILYYSDMRAYVLLKKPITGEAYVKDQFGPVSSHLLGVLEELQAEGRIAASVVMDDFGSYPRNHFVATRMPGLDAFRPEEVSIVEQYMDLITERYTAAGVSEASHDIVYNSAGMGQVIPYHAAYVHTIVEPSNDTMEWAREELKRRGISDHAS